MLISAIVPTYMREDLLGRAVDSVLSQGLPDGVSLEVVVVNDAEPELSVAGWQEERRVTVVHSHRAERCFARNAGAALSSGDYLNFLDDDDMLLPGAYMALLRVAQTEHSAWTYGAYRVTDRNDELEETIEPTISGHIFAVALAGAGIPHQASLIERKAFFASGGWDPAFTVSEDQDLMLRIAGLGKFAFTDCEVAQIRRGIAGSGGDWSATERCWIMKVENALSRDDCLRQITVSLHDRYASLRGQVVRKYLGSAARHVRNGACLTALSRLGVGVRLMLPGLLAPQFWSGLRGAS